MKDIRERLKMVLNHHSVALSSIAVDPAMQTRLSRQVNAGSSITYDTIYRFLEVFQNVSAEWLIRGKGKMILSDNLPPIIGDESENDLNTHAMLAQAKKDIDSLNIEIASLKNELLKKDGAIEWQKEFISELIDEKKELLIETAKKYFDGDIYSLCEEYFRCVGDVVAKTGADIIGHFDLISKFNEDGSLFDENHPRYVEAYRAAIEKLIPYSLPFEVNTGAISRGYRKKPYPSLEQIKYIASLGGTVVLTGDTHNAENLCFEFEKWNAECEKIGVNIKTHW